MRWFGRKSAPDVRPFVPAWLSAEGQSGFARSYDTQFEEVFRGNPVGQRAVRLVSGALPVYAAEGDEQAAAIASADRLLEGIAANLLLHGNAYAQLLTGDDGAPAEICLLRPERVSVVTLAERLPLSRRGAGDAGHAMRRAGAAADGASEVAASARRPLRHGLRGIATCHRNHQLERAWKPRHASRPGSKRDFDQRRFASAGCDCRGSRRGTGASRSASNAGSRHVLHHRGSGNGRVGWS